METPQETSQEMQSQWEKLQQEKQQIAKVINDLRQKIHARNDDKISLLMRRMEELQKVIKDSFNSIGLREKDIEDRKTSVREKKMKMLVEKFQERARKVGCLLSDDYRKRNVVFQSSTKLNRRYRQAIAEEFLSAVTLPEDQRINEENKQDEEAISSLMDFLEKAKSDLVRVKAKIKEKCDEVKKLLENEVKKVKEELRIINEEIARWDTKDIGHHASLPAFSASPPRSKFSFRKRKRKDKRDLPVATSRDQNGHQRKKIWKFFVVFSESKQGEELSSNKSEFSSRLKDILNEVKYRGAVDACLIYKKLTSLTEATPYQRRARKEIFEEESQFFGWKIINVGKRHRLFYDVDEEKNYIRFTITPRKEAYGSH